MTYSGGLTANWSTLLQRGLNLIDATDPVACRQNIGAVSLADVMAVASTTGEANKLTKYDTAGDLTTRNKINFGSTTSNMYRNDGVNGTGGILHTGTGLFKIDAGGDVQVSANSLSASSLSGTCISDSVSTTSSSRAASLTAVKVAYELASANSLTRHSFWFKHNADIVNASGYRVGITFSPVVTTIGLTTPQVGVILFPSIGRYSVNIEWQFVSQAGYNLFILGSPLDTLSQATTLWELDTAVPASHPNRKNMSQSAIINIPYAQCYVHISYTSPGGFYMAPNAFSFNGFLIG
jgi:hypothetical protein